MIPVTPMTTATSVDRTGTAVRPAPRRSAKCAPIVPGGRTPARASRSAVDGRADAVRGARVRRLDDSAAHAVNPSATTRAPAAQMAQLSSSPGLGSYPLAEPTGVNDEPAYASTTVTTPATGAAIAATGSASDAIRCHRVKPSALSASR